MLWCTRIWLTIYKIQVGCNLHQAWSYRIACINTSHVPHYAKPVSWSPRLCPTNAEPHKTLRYEIAPNRRGTVRVLATMAPPASSSSSSSTHHQQAACGDGFYREQLTMASLSSSSKPLPTTTHQFHRGLLGWDRLFPVRRRLQGNTIFSSLLNFSEFAQSNTIDLLAVV